jgi:hypothetical protein
MVKSNLLAGRLMYWKNAPGDCPLPSKLSLGPIANINKGLSIAATGAGTAGSLGALPFLGAAAGPLALIAIPFAIWGVISAHHKIAVAKEQATICDVSQAYNQYEDTIEAGLVSGQITAPDAKAAILTIETQLYAALQAIVKNGCDAACYFQKALKALDLYAVEKLYDTLGPRASSGNPANIAAGSVFLPKSKAVTYGAAAVGGLAAFKLAGVLI